MVLWNTFVNSRYSRELLKAEKNEGGDHLSILGFEDLGFWINIVAPEFNPVTCRDSDGEKWGWDKCESMG